MAISIFFYFRWHGTTASSVVTSDIFDNTSPSPKSDYITLDTIDSSLPILTVDRILINNSSLLTTSPLVRGDERQTLES
jgi:hypothetical protein